MASASADADADGTSNASRSADHRTRRRGQRRDRVYKAAVELFIEQGYDRTTMEEIAARADVARTSVFNYYVRKSAFLDEWGARRRARAFGRDAGLDAAAPLGHRLSHAMRMLAAVSTSSRSETVALTEPALRMLDILNDPPVAYSFSTLIQDSADELAPDLDIHLAGQTLAAGYFAVLRTWARPGPPPFDLEARLLGLADLVLHGAIRPATPR